MQQALKSVARTFHTTSFSFLLCFALIDRKCALTDIPIVVGQEKNKIWC
jgi:hypothetical protein